MYEVVWITTSTQFMWDEVIFLYHMNTLHLIRYRSFYITLGSIITEIVKFTMNDEICILQCMVKYLWIMMKYLCFETFWNSYEKLWLLGSGADAHASKMEYLISLVLVMYTCFSSCYCVKLCFLLGFSSLILAGDPMEIPNWLHDKGDKG